MSFLERLGLRAVSSFESNHGSPELENYQMVSVDTTKNIMIDAKLLSLDTSVQSSDHCSIETSTDKLLFAANTFTSESLVVAKGFSLVLSLGSPILDLYVLRTRDVPLRVAQIGVDGDFKLQPELCKYVDGVATLKHGIYYLLPDGDGDLICEFYFVSKIVI